MDHSAGDTDPAFHEGRFTERTVLADARTRLLSAITPLSRTETVPVDEADGAVLAESLSAPRDVPGYRRAAMDGYAVRAADTATATSNDPVTLTRTTDRVETGEGQQVHTGSEVPPGADAVIRVEGTSHNAETIDVFQHIEPGTNVAPPDEDVAAGTVLYDPGHRLRPPDLGLLRAVGISSVVVRPRPRVSVIPTGEELVEREPAPGEVVETNGLTTSRYVSRWGGDPTYRDSVPDDPDRLSEVLSRDADHDLLVTTGGSSVGGRDHVPEAIEKEGDLLVHGVAIKPGHPVGFGLFDGVPILMLPGYPVSTIVAAAELLRPAIAQLQDRHALPFPSVRARLTDALESEPGTRTYERVRLTPASAETDVDWRADPVRAAGAGVLSSVGAADGWVVVSEDVDRLESTTVVDVQDWDSQP